MTDPSGYTVIDFGPMPPNPADGAMDCSHSDIMHGVLVSTTGALTGDHNSVFSDISWRVSNGYWRTEQATSEAITDAQRAARRAVRR